ncbi:MAG: hypothetical protein R2715_12305 [Ilumatobacteraceae bacterium]
MQRRHEGVERLGDLSELVLAVDVEALVQVGVTGSGSPPSGGRGAGSASIERITAELEGAHHGQGEGEDDDQVRARESAVVMVSASNRAALARQRHDPIDGRAMLRTEGAVSCKGPSKIARVATRSPSVIAGSSSFSTIEKNCWPGAHASSKASRRKAHP